MVIFFEGAKFDNVSFKYVYLSSAVPFKNTYLAGADFSNKNLSNMDFTNANLVNANLANANLANANLANANLVNVNLNGNVYPFL